jgi:hypothetical protein
LTQPYLYSVIVAKRGHFSTGFCFLVVTLTCCAVCIYRLNFFFNVIQADYILELELYFRKVHVLFN